jgi:polyhydroxyalkanoate synthesis regulator phasin
VAKSIKKSRTNAAGQSFKCARLVNETLETMESRLQDAFSNAARPKSTRNDREAFKTKLDEIEQDVKKLSPAFKIVSPNGPFNADKYEFTVDKEKHITASQALQYLQQLPPPPLTQQEEIEALKKEVAALKNPPIARLDKNTPPSP